MSHLDTKSYPPGRMYSAIEIDHLRIVFPACDDIGHIDAIMEDDRLGKWLDDKGLVKINERKFTILRMLEKKEDDLKATRRLRQQCKGVASVALTKSRLAQARYRAMA